MTRSHDADTSRGRFAATVRQAIEQVLARGLADPRVKGMITVTDFELSKDRRNGTVSVSIIPEEAEDLTMHGLKAATGHIRTQAMKRVRSRSFPQIAFVLDRGIKAQAEVFRLINQAKEEEGARPTVAGLDAPDGSDAGVDAGGVEASGSGDGRGESPDGEHPKP